MQIQLHSGAEFYLDGLIVECILGNLRARSLATAAMLCRTLRLPAQAAAYLSKQQQALLDAGVPAAQLDEALAIVQSAASAAPGQAAGGSIGGADTDQKQVALVGGALAAVALAAAAGFYLSPAELVPADVVSATADLASAAAEL